VEFEAKIAENKEIIKISQEESHAKDMSYQSAFAFHLVPCAFNPHDKDYDYAYLFIYYLLFLLFGLSLLIMIAIMIVLIIDSHSQHCVLVGQSYALK